MAGRRVQQRRRVDNQVIHRITYEKQKNSEFETGSGLQHCFICKANFPMQITFSDHMKQHLESDRTSDVGAKFNLGFDNETYIDEVAILIKKLNAKKLTLTAILLIHPDFWVIDLLKNVDSVEKDATKEIFTTKNHFLQINKKYLFVLVFQDDSNDMMEFFEEHVLTLTKIPVTQPNMTQQPTEAINKQPPELRQTRLQRFLPPKGLESVVKQGFKTNCANTIPQQNLITKYEQFLKPENILSPKNYFELMTFMLHIEECFQSAELAKLNMKNIKINVEDETMSFEVDKKFQRYPSLADQAYIRLEDQQTGRFINAKIDSITKTHLTFVSFEHDNANRQVNTSRSYSIDFCLFRRQYQVEHTALELLKKTSWKTILFPNINVANEIQKIHSIKFKWVNPKIQHNIEQQEAIKNIVLGTSCKVPYIIFGPPGTGKTITIIEAIMQILKKFNDPHILMTAMSNAACDEIALRLMDQVPCEQLFRMYSETAWYPPNKTLLSISNLRYTANGRLVHFYPGLSIIKKFKIVIATMTTCGRLANANISPHHFSHLFIDECGSARETTAMIPIAGVVTSRDGIHAKIILSGDPMQLGPLIYCREASENLGFKISLLERLMGNDVYKKNTINGKYNRSFITKLVKNFRSHPKIFEVSNDLFYDKEITAAGPKATINAGLNWKHLPNKKFPIIFDNVSGQSETTADSPSCFNRKEINAVISYIEKLIKNPIPNFTRFEHIGVISPYRQQVLFIEEEFAKRKWNIQVGTIESFQGQENAIVIVSTVRAGETKIGFLNNPKRLNVALTRAKALLIVIGDVVALKNCDHWKKFIDFCAANGGVCNHKEF